MTWEALMRKIGLILLILAILGLDWAALHDILKGESDVQLEWAFVLTNVLLLAVVLAPRFYKAD